MVINKRSNVYVNMTSGLPDVRIVTRLLLRSACVWIGDKNLCLFGEKTRKTGCKKEYRGGCVMKTGV